MARAKSTARAEARRRYRASQGAADDTDSVAEAATGGVGRGRAASGHAGFRDAGLGAAICAPFPMSCEPIAGGGSVPCCCCPAPVADVLDGSTSATEAGGVMQIYVPAHGRSRRSHPDPRRRLHVASRAISHRPPAWTRWTASCSSAWRLRDLGRRPARRCDAGPGHDVVGQSRSCRPRSLGLPSPGSRSSTRAGCRTRRGGASSSARSRRRSRSARRATRLARRAPAADRVARPGRGSSGMLGR